MPPISEPSNDPIGTAAELKIALEASIEANKRMAAELALSDTLARAAENLLAAWQKSGDLVPYYQALSAALADYKNAVGKIPV